MLAAVLDAEWHPATMAWLQQVQIAGGNPSTIYTDWIDSVIRELLAAGVYSLLDGLYMMAAPDAITAGINLVNPGTFTLTNSGCTFTANQGYAGASGTNAVNTNAFLNLAGLNLSQNNACIFTWNTSAGTTFEANGSFSTTRTYAGPGATGVVTSNVNCTTNLTISNSTRSGLFLNSRYGASNTDCWANGVLIGNQTASTSVALTAIPINASGVSSITNNPATTSLFGFGAGLSQQQASLTYEIFHRFTQAIAGVA